MGPSVALVAFPYLPLCRVVRFSLSRSCSCRADPSPHRAQSCLVPLDPRPRFKPSCSLVPRVQVMAHRHEINERSKLKPLGKSYA